eukprot:snap_masked-scaffold_5-processed-gene-7.37-mRNA-1 protein AED:1.00 eAED:1.00 QI:0/-1/0/1/-1/1/1/0/407
MEREEKFDFVDSKQSLGASICEDIEQEEFYPVDFSLLWNVSAIEEHERGKILVRESPQQENVSKLNTTFSKPKTPPYSNNPLSNISLAPKTFERANFWKNGMRQRLPSKRRKKPISLKTQNKIIYFKKIKHSLESPKNIVKHSKKKAFQAANNMFYDKKLPMNTATDESSEESLVDAEYVRVKSKNEQLSQEHISTSELWDPSGEIATFFEFFVIALDFLVLFILLLNGYYVTFFIVLFMLIISTSYITTKFRIIMWRRKSGLQRDEFNALYETIEDTCFKIMVTPQGSQVLRSICGAELSSTIVLMGIFLEKERAKQTRKKHKNKHTLDRALYVFFLEAIVHFRLMLRLKCNYLAGVSGHNLTTFDVLDSLPTDYIQGCSFRFPKAICAFCLQIQRKERKCINKVK